MPIETAGVSAKLMETMSIFASEQQVKAVLQEYLQRVVVSKPADPVDFLIKEIMTNPCRPPPEAVPVDARTVEDQMCCLDLRPLKLKNSLLRDLFDAYKTDGLVNRGELLVALQSNPTILLEKFPRHASDLPKCVETMVADHSGGIKWPDFSAAAIVCLATPGSSPGSAE